MSKTPMPKAQQVRKRVHGSAPKITEADLPQRENFFILIAGVAVIILGYIVMAMGDVESPLALTIGPIILVIGYVVVIPLGILYRRGQKKDTPEAPVS